MTRLGVRAGWPRLRGIAVPPAGLVTLVAGSIEALYPSLADREQ